MRFLHTADWQLGKPYGRIEDEDKRAEARRQRIRVIDELARLVREKDAEFVLVAGDLFDSSSVSRSTVSNACAAIGKISAPVYVIPGNHDHGGPGSIWEQEFFKQEASELAPNLHVLLKPSPIELETAVLFPCPLSRRAEPLDTTAWLRDRSVWEPYGAEKTRIVVAHGATINFESTSDDEEQGQPSNHIDLDRLPIDDFDYVALGDWHGSKQVARKAWYSGAPEPDRFPRGSDYESGNVLLVESHRGQAPIVEKLQVGKFRWHELTFSIHGEDEVGLLRQAVEELIGNRTGEDLLQLTLNGSVGIRGRSTLDQLLETLKSRLIRLKLNDRLQLAPSPEEILQLQEVPHPIIKRVAAKLIERTQSPIDDEAIVARRALLELYLATPKS